MSQATTLDPSFLKDSYKVNDILFDLDISNDHYAKQSSPEHFILLKTKTMIEDTRRVIGDKPIKNVVDLGIYKGGSCVLYQELYHPEKLLAFDYSPEPVTALTAYIENHGLQNSLKTYYGVDQSDAKTITSIIDKEFGTESIDLIVDDASHLYEQTKASFNLLFPRLSNEGVYVIEDWGWAHWPGKDWQQSNNAYFDGKPALTHLLLESVMACASNYEMLVKEVRVTGSAAYIIRGSGSYPQKDFDISSQYFARGKEPLAPVL